ncbi:MAG: histidine--tRNA ligase [Novosphingobium sp.]
METPQAIRGTQDIFGAEAEAFAHVVETFERVRKLYRFRRAEMPVFEKTTVFSRSLGETTDVVSKEMYSFDDRGGESLTLRPEFTAGIARAYLTNGWQQHAPLKLATHGPLFRYERPQKGRYRQFHQLDAEIIGAAEPQSDVELLVMADQLLKELGVADGVTLMLNTLGDGESREAWRSALIEYFQAHRTELSEDSQERLEKNPLRILDSKDPRDKVFVADAPKIDDYLSGEAQAFFGQVCEGLDAAGVEWTRAPALVRGLDYYRHTAFEFVTDRLGAQGTVLGGGRYDGLIETLGGPHTPAVGWAAGIERLAMLVGERDEPRPFIAFVLDDDDLAAVGYRSVSTARRAGIPAELIASGSFKKRFDRAKKLGCIWIATIDGQVTSNDQIANIRFKLAYGFPSVEGKDEETLWGALNGAFDILSGSTGSGMQENTVYELYDAGALIDR